MAAPPAQAHGLASNGQPRPAVQVSLPSPRSTRSASPSPTLSPFARLAGPESGPRGAGTGRALVVGNHKYNVPGAPPPGKPPLNDLPMSEGDADAIADLLENDAGFDEVIKKKNVTAATMRLDVLDMINRLRSGDTALVYFSGHGRENSMDLEMAGVPSGGERCSENVSLAFLIAELGMCVEYKGLRDITAVFLLDCCRESSYGKPACHVTFPDCCDLYIVYSTTTGKKAWQNLVGLEHSAFTCALLEHLHKPKPLTTVLVDVCNHVTEVSGRAGDKRVVQRPWFKSNSTRHFVLVGQWSPRKRRFDDVPDPSNRPFPSYAHVWMPAHLTSVEATVELIWRSFHAADAEEPSPSELGPPGEGHANPAAGAGAGAGAGSADAGSEPTTSVTRNARAEVSPGVGFASWPQFHGGARGKATTRPTVTLVTQAVTGLGGVGKTTAAKCYVQLRGGPAQYPSGVFWISAESARNVEDAIHALVVGDLEQVDRASNPTADTCAYFKRWLQSPQRKRWLVVFDNVNDPEDVRPYMPSGVNSRGHILVTSRLEASYLRSNGMYVSNEVTVECLPHDAAALLLLRCATNCPGASIDDVRDPKERMALETLAGPSCLDGLPLALECVGALVHKAYKGSFQAAEQQFRDQPQALLKRIARLQPSPQHLLRRALDKYELVGGDRAAVMDVLRRHRYTTVRDLRQLKDEDVSLAKLASQGLPEGPAIKFRRLVTAAKEGRVRGSESVSASTTIMTVWSMNLSALDDEARDLFRMAAYMPADQVMEDMFVYGGAGAAEWAAPALSTLLREASGTGPWMSADAVAGRRYAVDTLVQQLAQYHLVSRTQVQAKQLHASPSSWPGSGDEEYACFSVHRLVQEVVRCECGTLDSSAGWPAGAAMTACVMASGGVPMSSPVCSDTSAEGVELSLESRPLYAYCAAVHIVSIMEHVSPDCLQDVYRKLPAGDVLLTVSGGVATSDVDRDGVHGVEVDTWGHWQGGRACVAQLVQGCAEVGYHAADDMGRTDVGVKLVAWSADAAAGMDPSTRFTSTYRQGRLQHDVSDFDAAIETSRAALSLARELHGDEEHVDVWTAMNNLGRVFLAAGQFDSARPLLVEALNLARRLYGLYGHRNVWSSLNNLAVLLQSADNAHLDEAGEKLAEALTMIRRSRGDGDHRDVWMGLNNLGQVRMQQGRLSDAEPLLTAGLEMQRRLRGGAPHGELFTALRNMGNLLSKQGKHLEALGLAQEAADVIQRLHKGSDHPTVAVSLSTMAQMSAKVGNYAAAVAACAEALAIRRRLHNSADAAVASALHELAVAELNAGQVAVGEAHLREAVEVFSRLQPTPSTIAGKMESMRELAVALLRLGRPADSDAMLTEAVAEARELGDKHVLSSILAGYARMKERLGDGEGAVPLFEEALQLQVELHRPTDHADVNALRFLLAQQLVSVERVADAVPHVEAALASARRLGDMSGSMRSWTLLAELYERLGAVAKATAALTDSLALVRQLGTDATDGAGREASVSLHRLGLIHAKHDRFDDAEALFQESLAIDRRLHGDTHRDLIPTMRALAEVREQRGDSPAADVLWTESVAVARRLARGDLADRAAAARCMTAAAKRHAGADSNTTAVQLATDSAELVLADIEADRDVAAGDAIACGEVLVTVGQWDRGQQVLLATLGFCRCRSDLLSVEAVLRVLGTSYQQRGQHDKAEPMLREAVYLCQQRDRGAPSAIQSSVLTELGVSLKALGRLDEAVRMIRAAVAMLRKLDRQREVPLALLLLASVMSEQGKHSDADRLRAEAHALATAQTASGGESDMVMRAVLASRAEGYVNRGNAEQGEAMLRALLQRERDLHGPDHQSVAYLDLRLARLCAKQHRIDEAKRLASEGLDIVRRLQRTKPDSAQLLHALDVVWRLLYEADCFDDMEPYILEAARLRREQFGSAAPGDTKDMQLCLHRLAKRKTRRGQPSTAIPLMVESLALARLQHGTAPHPVVSTKLDMLGKLYREAGCLTEARTCLEEALDMDKALHSDGRHANIAVAYTSLASVLMKLNEGDRAVAMLREAVEVRRRLHRGDHKKVCNALTELWRAQVTSGDDGGACSVLKELLAMQWRLFDSVTNRCGALMHLDDQWRVKLLKSVDTADDNELQALQSLWKLVQRMNGSEPSREASALLDKLGRKHLEMGHLAAADRCLTAALDMDRRLHERPHINVAVAMIGVAEVRTQQDRVDEAETLLSQAHDVADHLYGASRALVIEAVWLHRWRLSMRQQDERQAAASLGKLLEVQRRHLEEAMAPPPVVSFDEKGNVAVAEVLTLTPEGGFGVSAEQKEFNREIETLTELVTMARMLHDDGDHTVVATGLLALGEVYVRASRLWAARRVLQEALAMERRLHADGPHPDVAKALTLVGSVQVRFFDAAAGQALLCEATAMWRAIRKGADREGAVASLRGLWLSHVKLGQWDAAAQLLPHVLGMDGRLLAHKQRRWLEAAYIPWVRDD